MTNSPAREQKSLLELAREQRARNAGGESEKGDKERKPITNAKS